ncbi:hypothetical protein CRUP_029201 [Coryphaenoides rupestris]|nr:hypothetical protein CRUP_029201 [Coryphaenoides rupestris]
MNTAHDLNPPRTLPAPGGPGGVGGGGGRIAWRSGPGRSGGVRTQEVWRSQDLDVFSVFLVTLQQQEGSRSPQEVKQPLRRTGAAATAHLES